jgi:feruloyl esterase
MRHLPVIVVCALALSGASTGVPSAQSRRAIECAVAGLQSQAPAGTTVTSAAIVAAASAAPQHCLVEGHVATPGNTVNFRLGLPTAWNGKFYFEGVGGFAGSIGPLRAGLTRGYAAASTDTGHQGGATDASWALNNPAREIDFGHRGTHVTAVAAKALTQSYYGSAPRHAYFNGCSNGGRQALMEAQRYADDFDGIIAGNPSLGTLGSLRRTLVYQTMLASADRAIPPAKLRVISKAVLANCDGTDGLVDGLIDDPRACSFRPETLACSGADGPDCLTAGQLETVKAIYAEMTAPEGAVLPGIPPGHEDGTSGWQAWITGAVPPVPQPDGRLVFSTTAPLGFRFQDGYMKFLGYPEDNPNFDLKTFSLTRDWPKLAAQAPTFSPSDPNLGAFQQRGGKLILYHGWADPGISAFGTLRYYEDVVKTAGGHEQSDRFARLFMAPGMHHCQGNGPGPNTFDMLTALESWVERGVAPTRIIASHATGASVDRTRPLCAYPEVARYTGSGSIDAAENFRCQPPGPTPARPAAGVSAPGP